MKYALFLLALVSIACSTSQFTVYKPNNEPRGWKIEVEKSLDTFTLKIDGVSVLKESIKVFGTQFEATGSYKGKKIYMFGYRSSSRGYNGELNYRDQVRVIIDDVEVTKFDFDF